VHSSYTGVSQRTVGLPDGSRVRRESHARFCERLAVQSRWPTHHLVPGNSHTTGNSCDLGSRTRKSGHPGVTPSYVSTSRLLRESGALWWLPKISLLALAAARKPYYCGISNSYASAVSPRRLCSLLHRLLLPCTKHQLPGSIAALQHDAPVTPNSKGTSAITVCVFAECLSRQSL